MPTTESSSSHCSSGSSTIPEPSRSTEQRRDLDKCEYGHTSRWLKLRVTRVGQAAWFFKKPIQSSQRLSGVYSPRHLKKAIAGQRSELTAPSSRLTPRPNVRERKVKIFLHQYPCLTNRLVDKPRRKQDIVKGR
ncbi:hypothetical protein CSUI_009553, partial [Cystoisospora suis]